MKSPMITKAKYLTNKSGYTDLMVCQSAAGYYIGTMWEEKNAAGEVLWQEPGSRDSDYYKTAEDAQKCLNLMLLLGDEVADAVLRSAP